MQYIFECYDCDEYYQGPAGSSCVRKAEEHAADTTHTMRVSGVYDSPMGGGVYVGDEGDEYHKADRKEKAKIMAKQRGLY